MRNFSMTILLLGILLSCVDCRNNEKQLTLSGNWDAFNKTQIEKLINTYGKSRSNYNPEKPPYAVFDCDNTTIFLDIEETNLAYQLENLIFGCTPNQLKNVLCTGIDTTIVLKDANLSGGKFTTSQIATDITASYTWLYNNYKPLGGKGSLTLDEVKKNPNYANFTTKVRFLYDAICNTFTEEIAYPWITYLFTGLDSTQVRDMAAKNVKWQMSQKIGNVVWTSPGSAELPGQQAGQVSVTWKTGLRLVPEMQDLHNKLREAGFDVWMCSASFVDLIKEVVSNPSFGYNDNPTNVIAMELEHDPNGKILPVFRNGYDQTQRTGKTKAITRFLAGPSGKYGYDPSLVAGDSEGDQNMLSDFKGLKIGLIINRLKGKNQILGDLCKQAVDTYQQDNAKYLLQGRDDNKGIFIPSQEHLKYGSTSGTKLPE